MAKVENFLDKLQQELDAKAEKFKTRPEGFAGESFSAYCDFSAQSETAVARVSIDNDTAGVTQILLDFGNPDGYRFIPTTSGVEIYALASPGEPNFSRSVLAKALHYAAEQLERVDEDPEVVAQCREPAAFGAADSLYVGTFKGLEKLLKDAEDDITHSKATKESYDSCLKGGRNPTYADFLYWVDTFSGVSRAEFVRMTNSERKKLSNQFQAATRKVA